MASFLWPGDPGWPMTPVDEPEVSEEADPRGEVDLDAVSLHAMGTHVLDDLNEVERRVLSARFGLDGTTERSIKELHVELNLTRHEVRDALETGLASVRSRLTG